MLLDPTVISIEALDECKDILEEFIGLLNQYNPRTSKNIGNCLKALLWALRKDSIKCVIDRLERHKSNFELTLLTLSM
jgi:hypothetical protein